MNSLPRKQRETQESELPGGTILLVDDERPVLNALIRSLRRTPWKILTAESGEEGLEILRQEPVHVIVSDYRMEGMDGVTFLKHAKEDWPITQRVMLTGHASFEAVESAVNDSEVFRFLNKPWLDSHLIGTIKECIERHQLISSNKKYESELAARNREMEELNQELEKKVEERTKALIQAEKMAAVGRMAGGVAHELNNPLGGILAFVQVLIRDIQGSDAQVDESLNVIETCALRCKRIVDNLLSFSRKSSGEPIKELDLNRVAKDGLVIAKLHPKAKEVSVSVELCPEPVLVTGRAGQLEQVIVNLLQNAFQASSYGSTVVLRSKMEEGKALIEVVDNGPGISEEVQAHIFEPFYTTKVTGEGTGLGLFICYGIAVDHGGAVKVFSQEGNGTTFTLELPQVDSGKEKEWLND
jgi:signal transduction histidine kinase